MGLEPTPGPWQGPVLPLYYGRPIQRNFNTPLFCRQDPGAMEIAAAPGYTPVRECLAGQASFDHT